MEKVSANEKRYDIIAKTVKQVLLVAWQNSQTSKTSWRVTAMWLTLWCEHKIKRKIIVTAKAILSLLATYATSVSLPTREDMENKHRI